MAQRGDDHDAVDLPGLHLEAEVGRGGFGVVHRAREVAHQRTVAVKVLGERMIDDEARRRFDHECRAMGRVGDHPNIVSLHGSGVAADGRPYLVMEFMTGGSLADRLATNGPVPWTEVLDIGVRLAGAMETAHRAGVLHRDIKPENVLVSGYGEPCLADFGVARLDGAATTRGAVTASLAHAAPEVLGGTPPSVASDVWGLGSTLLALLLGRPPFADPGDRGLHPLLSRIVTAPVPDVRSLGVPDDVATPLEAAMAKEADDRPASAAALGWSLQDAQRRLGLPVTEMRVSEPADADPTIAMAPVPRATPDAAATRRHVSASPDDPVPPKNPRRPDLLVGAALAAVAVVGAGVLLATRPSPPTSPVVLDATDPAPEALSTPGASGGPATSPTPTPSPTPDTSAGAPRATAHGETGSASVGTTTTSPPAAATRQPTPTPTPTSSPTPSPTPTATTSTSPIPTTSPTPTPKTSASPTTSPTATSSPTSSPSPTTSATPSPTPTATSTSVENQAPVLPTKSPTYTVPVSSPTRLTNDDVLVHGWSDPDGTAGWLCINLMPRTQDFWLDGSDCEGNGLTFTAEFAGTYYIDYNISECASENPSCGPPYSTRTNTIVVTVP